MKFRFLLQGAALACASAVALTACSDSNEPNNGKNDVDDSANIEYNEKNAASWGNYMAQVSNLLSKDATDLYNAWNVSYQGGKPFAQSFKEHNSSDYTSAVSCLEQIIDGCADIANEVGTAKIGDPYNLYISGNEKEALYAVESWYSWHSRDDYSNNILSIRNSYYGSLDNRISDHSMSALIATVDPDLDSRMKNAIDNAYKSILSIPQPFRNHINSNEARAAMTACSDLEDLLSNELKPAIGKLADDTRLQAIVDHYTDEVVLPTYAKLKDLNDALHQAVVKFQKTPSDDNFAYACNAWLEAREPWEKSEAFLFGPVDALGLDPNMDSWPLDQDNIVQILNSGNYDDLNWSDGDSDDAIEAVQSVRGFHTLEFLLFKDGQPRKVK